MNCANCGADNRKGVRFCTKCGSGLELEQQVSGDHPLETPPAIAFDHITRNHQQHGGFSVSTLLKWMVITTIFLAVIAAGIHIMTIATYGWHYVVALVLIGVAGAWFTGFIKNTFETRKEEIITASAVVGVIAISVAVTMVVLGRFWQLVGVLIVTGVMIWASVTKEDGTI